MNKTLFLALAILCSSTYADEAKRKPYPKVYPFVPFTTEKITKDVKRMAEDSSALLNIFEMYAKGLLHNEKTKETPWVSTYWPLNKGGIADPYKGEQTAVGAALRGRKTFSWTHNYNRLKKRRDRSKFLEYSEEELAKLSPSEKYDLILGDETFDLTNKQLDYMYKWGSKKEHGFLSKLDIVGGSAYDYAKFMVANKYVDKDGNIYRTVDEALPDAIKLRGGIADQIAYKDYRRGRFASFQEALERGLKLAVQKSKNYVLKKKNDFMALWEGICNGWSTAAGVIPRPLHSFHITLPNGKRLKFYPEDVKGLISQYWFNSLIQNGRYDYKDQVTGQNKFSGGTLMQGLRCNDKSPKKDEWGRFYDSKPDAFTKTGKIEPRCVGVHPAIWHASLINIIGVQKRSFIVERKVKAAVDNHPMSDYKMSFFNPYDGKDSGFYSAIVPINSDDKFRKFRNKRAKYVVGVATTMAYVDWKRPERRERENSQYDWENRKEVEMLYDLELDEQGNIVGGQWRVAKDGKHFLNIGADRTQPDFFWTITKDWKKSGYFNERTDLPAWTDTTRVPPKEWLAAAKQAHAFKYEKTHAYNWNEKCEVVNEETNEIVEVPCEFKEDKPQPLLNVINKLLELSRQ